MLNISITEFIVFVVLAILILDPEKLPHVLLKARAFYKKSKYLFDHNIYDLEAQIEKYCTPSASSAKQYHYLDPIALSPYQRQFILQLFQPQTVHLCNIGLIHQMHSQALKQEIWEVKRQHHSADKNSVQHLQEVA